LAAGDFDPAGKNVGGKYFGVRLPANAAEPRAAQPNLKLIKKRVFLVELARAASACRMVWHSVCQRRTQRRSICPVLRRDAVCVCKSNLQYGSNCLNNRRRNGRANGTFQVTLLPGKCSKKSNAKSIVEPNALRPFADRQEESRLRLESNRNRRDFLQRFWDKADALNSNAVFNGKSRSFSRVVETHRELRPPTSSREENLTNQPSGNDVRSGKGGARNAR